MTKFVIDAGHGGVDSGATSSGVNEKDITLMISKYMYDKLKEKGYPVVLTRTDDETLNPTDRVNRILSAYGNDPEVIVISNHINSSGTPTSTGAEVIYALRNESTLAQNILDALGNAGLTKRSVYQRRLPSNPNQDYYFIHRNTGQTEPLIIEYGFINNPSDLSKIQRNYKRYVDAVVNAIDRTILNSDMPNNFPTEIPENIPIMDDSEAGIYIVKKGDSLYKIANMYNTSVIELKLMNNLLTDNISIGQMLKVPSNNETDIYTVKKGDSLYKIANMYNTTVDELKKINNLTSNLISIGQNIKIPSVINNTIMHIVKKGDTLYKIANIYGTTVSKIKADNNLLSDMLSIGQELIIM